MSAEPATLHTSRPMLLRMVAIALLAATLIVVCFVLPAEFRVDPTGVGRATGVIELAGPKTVSADELAGDATGASVAGDAGSADGAAAPGNTKAGAAARYYEGGYRADFVDIPLAVSGSADRGEELEYKVFMKAGATLAYSWSVPGIANPEEFYFDFHGESRSSGQAGQGTVIEYKQATGTQSHGTLVAPFDGVFGWYLQNQSEKPVVVHLKISGFYDLVPPGDYGNEAGIEANRPAPAR